MKIEIETKFDIGDLAYFMKNNKVNWARVNSIEIKTTVRKPNDVSKIEILPTYKMRDDFETVYQESGFGKLIYKSKEELLKSL